LSAITFFSLSVYFSGRVKQRNIKVGWLADSLIFSKNL
jgi:hypothetical protein